MDDGARLRGVVQQSQGLGELRQCLLGVAHPHVQQAELAVDPAPDLL